MNFTRRQFTTGALAAGAVLALGAPRHTHGAKATTDRPTPQHERKTFHFHLPDLHPDGTHVLHAGGERYRLEAHTAATRQRARRTRRGLAHLREEHLTHYAEDVWVSKDGVQRLHVTTHHPERGPGLALVAMHIATGARRRARRARLGSTLLTATNDVCTLQDQVEDDYLTGWSTAKAIITHHPDLCTLDPDTAAAIETHMDGDQAAAVNNLALSICNQGPAYEYDPAFLDGWCVLVPNTNPDGSPMLDPQGHQIYDYQFSAQTKIDMKPAIETLLHSVKNDSTLNGAQYTVIYHGDPVDEAALPPATPAILSGDQSPALLAAASPRRQKGVGSGSGDSVALAKPGYHHNVLFYDLTYDSTPRRFTLQILNLNFIWYGLYLEYLDGNGQPIATSKRSSLLNDLVATGLDLETDTLKFWDIVSAPPTVFGVPTPYPYKITINLDDDALVGAAAVRLNLIGPGNMGNVVYGPSVIAGIVLTAMCCYGVPIYFLSKGVGEIGTKGLVDLIKQPGTLLKILLALAQAVSGLTKTNTNDEGFSGAVEGFLVAFIQDLILNPKAIPELWAWLTGEVSEAEAAESTPFVGWVVRIMAILGTVADLATTSAEIGANPALISNTVSFTHSLTIVIHHDPDDFEFPLTATSYLVQVTVSGRAIGIPAIAISNEERSNDTLTVQFPPVPSTSAPATVQVLFITAAGYPIAHSAAVNIDGQLVLGEDNKPVAGEVTFLNKLPAGGGPLVIDVPIVENPFPITQQTQYVAHQKLEYAGGGTYTWNYTSPLPALEAANCGPSSGLCELGNVTVWVPGGMIGYSWRAASPSVHDCRTGATGQLYTFQNVSLKNDPNPGRKAPGCGFPGPTPLAYDSAVRVGEPGQHFYLDPVNISDDDPVYYLRRLTLDTTTPVDVSTTESWGRFRIPLDRLAVWAKGDTPMVVGISSRYHKFSVLELPTTPFTTNGYANNAKVLAGPGEGNDSLILNPAALTLADNGAILILQGGAFKRVKAFDFDGKPWKFFSQGTSSVLNLVPESGTVTWLDISIDPTNLLYILSHTGAGTQQSDYRLDVYDANSGQRLLRNTGIAVGRMVVDKFRGLYSLNYETVKGSPIVEPSVSVWAPTNPTSTPPPQVTLRALFRGVDELSLSNGIKQSLLSSLERVRQELSRANRRGVESHLHVLVQKLSALRHTQLPGAHVDALLEHAHALLAAL